MGSGRIFRVDDWEIDPQTCRIRRGDNDVKLEPKVMDLLVYMAHKQGEVLPREELLENIWTGTVVSYDALTGTVIKLRKAFGDDARQPRIIETLPKKGYRLIAGVTAADEPDVPAGFRSLEHKLTAILYADVVGYSRLTEQDEAGTHRVVSAYLEAFSQAIEAHKGNIVHYAGDAILAEFSAVAEAVNCAMECQLEFAARNSGIPADQAVQFRIGINIGDVIVDRDDIFGEGVNVAARLEALADPGGVCISEAVRGAVGNKLPFDYDFLGEQKVKNIAEPVRAWRVLAEPPAATGRSAHGKRWIAAGAAAVLAAVVAALVWVAKDDPETTRSEDVSSQTAETSAGPSLPDMPSIAVLPFVNTGNDPDHSYFSDGITDDLITDLSDISGLFVIARNSTFRYKGEAVDVRQVARALGVRYLLEGSVRRSGNNVRVNTQLIDGASGGQLWAARYDGKLQDVFELQDQITGKIIAALSLRLTETDKAHLARSTNIDPQAYDEFLKGWEKHWRFSREAFAEAEQHFRKAIEIEPGYARAHAALALIYWQAWRAKWHEGGGSWLAGWVRAQEELDKAMVNPTPLAHSLKANMLLHNRRYEEAIAEAEISVDINPSSATAYLAYADALSFAGRSMEAIDIARKAMRLDPNFPSPYLSVIGRAEFGLERYESAALTLERAISGNPRNLDAYVLLLSAHGHLERTDKTKALLVKLDERRKKDGMRGFTIDSIRNRWPYQDRSERARLVEGLKKAGVPEW